MLPSPWSSWSLRMEICKNFVVVDQDLGVDTLRRITPELRVPAIRVRHWVSDARMCVGSFKFEVSDNTIRMVPITTKIIQTNGQCEYAQRPEPIRKFEDADVYIFEFQSRAKV